MSFVKGKRITLSTGALKPIEELEVGEKIITRDKGIQEIRQIGQSTMRAAGDFALVVIKARALNIYMIWLLAQNTVCLFINDRINWAQDARKHWCGPNIW